MKSAVIVFPGSNRERDMIAALEKIGGTRPVAVWHAESELPSVDLIVILGGFSYGDYLRPGAIAARSPIMASVARAAERGGHRARRLQRLPDPLRGRPLPGVLMKNAGAQLHLQAKSASASRRRGRFSPRRYAPGQVIRSPVAHGDGNYRADDDDAGASRGRGIASPSAMSAIRTARVDESSPASSSEKRNILGMMPHPENLIEPLNGGTDGRPLFEARLPPSPEPQSATG